MALPTETRTCASSSVLFLSVVASGKGCTESYAKSSGGGKLNVFSRKATMRLASESKKPIKANCIKVNIAKHGNQVKAMQNVEYPKIKVIKDFTPCIQGLLRCT